MRVFHHSVTQRNAAQEFSRNKKVLRTVLFYAAADAATALAASCGAPQANINEFYFFPQRRRRT